MDQLNNSSIDLSIEAERKLARTFMGRIEWEMILIGVLQFTTWIATWVLVIHGIIPLLVGFLIALFTACNAYLPSHAGQHGHLSGGRKNLQWLDYLVGQISVIPLAQSHEILKATHLKLYQKLKIKKLTLFLLMEGTQLKPSKKIGKIVKF